MRYGCCSNMLSGGDGRTGGRIAEKLAALGFDYVELSIVECMALSSSERSELKRRLQDAGMKSKVMNSFFPRELKTTGPDADFQRIHAWCDEAMTLSKSLGAEKLVYGSPYSKSYPLGFDGRKAYDQLLNLHRYLDETAAAMDLEILIEPCHRWECNLINSFADGVALAKDLNGKRTKVLFDYYHFTRNAESLDALEQYGAEYLGHVHFACPFHPGEPERTFPLTRDEWDYKPFAQALKLCGYDGRISIEAVCKDFDGQAETALHVLKDLFH